MNKTHHANIKVVGFEVTCPKPEQPRGNRCLMNLPSALLHHPAPLCLLNNPGNTPRKEKKELQALEQQQK